MKILIDANILYPTIMRRMVMGAAEAGYFIPLWSSRILEEWRHTASKLGAEAGLQASGEIALMNANWPRASIHYDAALERRLWLPDAGDVHVLAAAISGSADAIMTMNRKDFPSHILAEEGLVRIDPDGYLLGCYEANADPLFEVAQKILLDAQNMQDRASPDGDAPLWTIRRLMRKARLPRLGKRLEQHQSG